MRETLRFKTAPCSLYGKQGMNDNKSKLRSTRTQHVYHSYNPLTALITANLTVIAKTLLPAVQLHLAV